MRLAHSTAASGDDQDQRQTPPAGSCHLPVQLRIGGFPDLAHAALAEQGRGPRNGRCGSRPVGAWQGHSTAGPCRVLVARAFARAAREMRCEAGSGGENSRAIVQKADADSTVVILRRGTITPGYESSGLARTIRRDLVSTVRRPIFRASIADSGHRLVGSGFQRRARGLRNTPRSGRTIAQGRTRTYFLSVRSLR